MRLGSHPLDQVTMQGVRTAALPGGSLLAWLHHHCLLPMQTLAAGVPGLTPGDLSLCQLISLTWWSKLSTWWVEPTPQDHCPWFFSHLFLFAAVFFLGGRVDSGCLLTVLWSVLCKPSWPRPGPCCRLPTAHGVCSKELLFTSKARALLALTL